MTDTPEHIRRLAQRVHDAGPVLRSQTLEERASWLVRAAERLKPNGPLGRVARRELPDETGLSEEMVAWGLETTVGDIRLGGLIKLAGDALRAAGPGATPASLVTVVLAGNVFAASVRAVFVPLLLGSPVLIKASSSETRFPRLLERALGIANPTLGHAAAVVSFPGGSAQHEAAMHSLADVVSVFGGDETVNAVTVQVPENVGVIGHGHGISVAYCGSEARAPDRVQDIVSGLALDVAAYDQRGCLSPQLIYIEDQDGRSMHSFASKLSNALDDVNQTLPRGPLPLAVGAAQAQWRGLAEVDGSLLEGASHALSVEPRQPRLSPGFRNASLVRVDGIDAAIRAMRPFGQHLKCVGTEASSEERLARALEAATELDAYVTAIGTMQTPAFDSQADGRPVWEGYLRRR